MKIVKQYLREAKAKGIQVSPVEIKIRTFKSNRHSLTEQEVNRMEQYFDDPQCLPKHRKILRYFLFSCYTAVRISDINVMTWNNVQDNLLVYVPVKTKFKNEKVSVPLLDDLDKRFLPAYTHDHDRIFDTFADAVSNRLLKEIAEKLRIRKTVTYHTSRHTFGSLMAEGGDIVATQRMMGHGDLKTTMGYVHTSVKQLIEAKRNRFEIRLKNNLLHGDQK